MKQNPPNSVVAQFSLPWTVATAIIYHKVEPKSFTEQALKNPNVLNLAHKVIPKFMPELTRQKIEPVIVEIQTKGRHVYSKRVDHALGSRENPMSTEDIIRKFRYHVTTYATKPIPGEKVDKTVQMVQQLESVADVGQIIKLLA